MIARRALPEDIGLAEEPSILLADTSGARRALVVETGRRGLPAAEPLVTPNARRALIEFDLGFDPQDDPYAVGNRAFTRPARPKRLRLRLLAAGLVACCASVTSWAIANRLSTAANHNTTPAPTQHFGDLPLEVRNESISRDEQRPETMSGQQLPSIHELGMNEVIAPGQRTPDTVEQAMAKAASMTGHRGYSNMCLSLVATFYGYTTAGEEGAQQAAQTIIAAGQMHYDLENIPVGALVWYDGTPKGNPFGHVAMYAGNGMVYSNGAPTGVGLIPLREPADGWGEPLIGWSTVWLPKATR